MKAYAPSNAPGAHQTESFQAGVRGYRGPCPPVGQGAHVYQLELTAVDVATLPGTSMATTRAQLAPILQAHALATATLSGMYAR